MPDRAPAEGPSEAAGPSGSGHGAASQRHRGRHDRPCELFYQPGALRGGDPDSRAAHDAKPPDRRRERDARRLLHQGRPRGGRGGAPRAVPRRGPRIYPVPARPRPGVHRAGAEGKGRFDLEATPGERYETRLDARRRREDGAGGGALRRGDCDTSRGGELQGKCGVLYARDDPPRTGHRAG